MIYRFILWIKMHPNHNAYRDEICCPKCGSEKIHRRGYQVALSRTYFRYQCQVCAAWFRGNKQAYPQKGERGVNVT